MVRQPAAIAASVRLGSAWLMPVLMRVSMVSAKMVATLPGAVPLRATSSLMELLPTSMTATVSGLGIAPSKSPGAGGSSLGRGFEPISYAGF